MSSKFAANAPPGLGQSVAQAPKAVSESTRQAFEGTTTTGLIRRVRAVIMLTSFRAFFSLPAPLCTLSGRGRPLGPGSHLRARRAGSRAAVAGQEARVRRGHPAMQTGRRSPPGTHCSLRSKTTTSLAASCSYRARSHARQRSACVESKLAHMCRPSLATACFLKPRSERTSSCVEPPLPFAQCSGRLLA